MSAHDPYAPEVRHARRVTVPAPPDPTDEVPGHEDEAIHWMLDAIGVDVGSINGPNQWAELVRRTDLVELAEFGRPGHMRPRVIAVVAGARAAHGATEAGQVGPTPSTAAIALLPDVVDGNPGPQDGTEAELIEAELIEAMGPEAATRLDTATAGDMEPLSAEDEKALIGEPVNDVEGNAAAMRAQDTADGMVPEKAAEVIAWIQGAPNPENAGRRAQRAWAIEVDRTGGIRATVQAEIDKHLEA